MLITENVLKSVSLKNSLVQYASIPISTATRKAIGFLLLRKPLIDSSVMNIIVIVAHCDLTAGTVNRKKVENWVMAAATTMHMMCGIITYRFEYGACSPFLTFLL